MATVTRENIGKLHDKLSVKITKEDYFESFEKKVKEYAKTANIPGFRKGMVPVGMVKKMYGASIFTDEVLKTVEKELYNYLNTERPEIFAQPLPLDNKIDHIDFNNPSEYSFDFEIGLKPDYSIADVTKAKVTFNKVEATDKMVDEELERMKVKAGKMTEPEIITSEENVLNILFAETDKDGVAIENGIVKENSVLLKYCTTNVLKQFMNKKVGDNITVKLTDAFEGDKLDAIAADLGLTKETVNEKYFNLNIVKIGLVEKRELNEEFFKEIYPTKEIKTEAELKENLKEEIQQYWNSQSKNQLQDQLYHYLLDETKIDFPETFLKKWLQNGGEKPKTAEEAETEFPGFSNQLKWTLISEKLTSDNKLQVGNDELKDFMKNEVMRYFGTMQIGNDTSWLDSYVDRMMKDEKQVDASYRRLITEKLFNWLEGNVKPTEKIVSPEDLAGMMHNHQH